jgi:carboxylesterase
LSRRRQAAADASDPKLLETESRKLRRTLLINTALDLVYVAGGILLAATLGRDNPAWRGHGWGIIVQGAFLFFFDLINAQCVPPASLSKPLRAFEDAVHRPFFLAGGDAAALLVHGFPGTPAEMRPLAETLHKQGWTVQGILLPGFGPQFSQILEYGQRDWLTAVEQALETLQRKYDPVILVGYSLGGALSLATAARFRAAGLVLFTPFWRLGTPLQRLIGLVLRPFLPRYFRPLQKADFNDPNLRRSLREFFPDIDLDEPETQAQMRDLQVPLSVIHQIMKAGRYGLRSARAVTTPTLVVQGVDDELVRPENTQKLVKRLGSRPSYLEIPGAHNMVDKGEPGWGILEQAVLEFVRSIRVDEKVRA